MASAFPAPRLLPPSSGTADSTFQKFPSKTIKFLPDYPRRTLPHIRKASAPASRALDSFICHCRKSPVEGDDSGLKGWEYLIQYAVRSAVKRWDDCVNLFRNSWLGNAPPANALAVAKELEKEEESYGVHRNRDDGGDWDWERWKKHIAEVEEQERQILVLKSQLSDAIFREDYEIAAKLKLAITAATKSDTVCTAISDLDRAIDEERYNEAAYIRDHCGAGLVGWWAGISDDGADPFGRIVRISAEHGRFVAKSYSPRQLASGRPGFPLFEVFFTMVNGDYKQQAVYLKHDENSGDDPMTTKNKPVFSHLNSSESSRRGEDDLHFGDAKAIQERDDETSMTDELVKIQNILQDIIPGVKVKVLKVISPGKVDKDVIAKVIEQIMEEEEEGSEEEEESTETEDIGSEHDNEGLEMDARDETSISEEESEVLVKVVISSFTPKVSADLPPKSRIPIPARIEKKDHLSFSFILEKYDMKHGIGGKGQIFRKKDAAQPRADHLISNLAKVITIKDKVHTKVLEDIGELFSYAGKKQNYHSLTGATLFSRIQVPLTSDPLSGLYVGAHGMYSSNILHLKRKFGQWQEHHGIKKQVDLEFYEYVEAIKLTGDPFVPAGQVAFRAKVGKQNQLPHKGIIPEEFGVVARYKGQGKLADPGYKNPRWVDGELVILDGKYIRGGPVIGFVYWAPESHFLLFFNRLRLPD